MACLSEGRGGEGRGGRGGEGNILQTVTISYTYTDPVNYVAHCSLHPLTLSRFEPVSSNSSGSSRLNE